MHRIGIPHRQINTPVSHNWISVLFSCVSDSANLTSPLSQKCQIQKQPSVIQCHLDWSKVASELSSAFKWKQKSGPVYA